MSKKVLVISSDVDSYEIARRMAKVTHFEYVFVDSLEKLQVQLNWSKDAFIAIHFDAAVNPIDFDGTANLLVSYANQIPIILYSIAQSDGGEYLNKLAALTYQNIDERAVDQLAKSLKILDLYASFITSEQHLLDWVDVRDGNDELVFQPAVKASKNDLPVLIEGGVGTPKAEMAVAAHKLSNRYRHAIKIVDASLYSTEDLVPAIFGADTTDGLIIEANRGTLFINNLNHFSDDIQDKISKFLDHRSVYSHSEKTNLNLDVRLIIATDLDLISEVKAGRLREALYYRLSVSPIIMNKFNTIAEDMRCWIGDFVSSLKPKYTHQDIEIEAFALDSLVKFNWPGNHQQFLHVLAWAISQSYNGTIRPDVLPRFLNPDETTIYVGDAKHKLAPDLVDLVSDTPSNEVLSRQIQHVEPSQYLNLFNSRGDMRSIEEVEEELIRRAIAFYDGKMSFVARQLGIGRSTLYRKLKEYEIDPDYPLELER
ncbi:MAG: sigma 54-interacting transcriptional regulator [Lentilitoribacter sp.]